MFPTDPGAAPETHAERPPHPAWPAAGQWPAGISRAALLVAIGLLLATFLLFSPPRGQTYPGAISWSDRSVLRPLIDVLSLNGLVTTDTGTEVKILAFHLAAVAGLVLLALRSARVGAGLPLRRRLTQPWLAAQLLLGGWVVLSGCSSFWSGDAALARGQTAVYALAVLCAATLAWTLEERDISRLLAAIVAVSAAGAALCIWYYHERNPFHRPGFPLGNPATLSAAILPAILIALSVLGGAAEHWWRKRALPPRAPLLGAAAALVPLLWCFALTNSRAAVLGLLVGLLAMLFFQAGRRLRWVMLVVVLTVVSLGGAWLLSASRLDMAMARGATIRFRIYAWRYAAQLWDQNWFTAALGQGAGQYPRLAGQFSVRDRSLDPVAFMDSALVEHAHNELFEVLTEIGLVGGVTFVGGFLATLVAGSILVRARARDPRRWLHLGLLAGLAALMTDAFFSPGLRLPGVPAVFWTVVGVIWAACRGAATAQTPNAAAPSRATPRRRAAALVALGLALAAGWVTARNWRGVLREEAASFAFKQGEYEQAGRGYEFARVRLIDPVRQLINHGRAVRTRFSLASTTCELLAEQMATPSTSDRPPTTAAVPDLDGQYQQAIEHCTVAYYAATELWRRAPTLMDAAQLAASAAELLARLHVQTEPQTARQWARQAGLAWRWQRMWRPYDFETLLALTHYDTPLAYHFGLLRDALRATDAYDRVGRRLSFGQMRARWNDALQLLVTRERFPDVLRGFLAIVGPVDPETDIDMLILSGAPEVYRLAAHAAALQHDYGVAQDYAARAVPFYRRMRPRFPTLYSIALLEQAEFALRDAPEQAQHAADLLRAAIDSLPVIQEQKYEQLVQPFRRRLVVALLASGDEGTAVELLRSELTDQDRLARVLASRYVDVVRLYIRQPPARRPDVTPWLQAALRQQPNQLYAWSWLAWLAAERGDVAGVHTTLTDAAAAGMATEDLEQVRRSLCAEFPALCEQIKAED